MKYFKLFENYLEYFGFENKEQVYKFANEICSKMNISFTEIKILGGGRNGVAIDLGESILKFSVDDSEAYFAKKLINIDSVNLVKIYDIKEIISDECDFYAIHEEKLITKLNSTITNLIYYLNNQNPISNNVETISDDKIYDFFKNKLISLEQKDILILYNKWKNVYNETKKYDIPLTDFNQNNVGIRESNPNELVYFDISDPYGSYRNKNYDLEKLFIK